MERNVVDREVRAIENGNEIFEISSVEADPVAQRMPGIDCATRPVEMIERAAKCNPSTVVASANPVWTPDFAEARWSDLSLEDETSRCPGHPR
jgi:hypothetical protein